MERSLLVTYTRNLSQKKYLCRTTCLFMMQKDFHVMYVRKYSQTRPTCIDICLFIEEKSFIVTNVGIFSQPRNNSHVTYARKFSQPKGSCINICLFIKWTNFLIARARQCSQQGTAKKDMCLFILLKIFLLTYARKSPKYRDLLLITESHLKIEHFIVICAINISKWSSCTYICLFIMNYLKKMDLHVNVAREYLWRRLACGDICYFAKKCQKEECISAPIEPV
jgi:hypothetical protein